MEKRTSYAPWRVIGHERTVRALALAARAAAPSHAYLFTGREGIGKRTVALTLAAALNCTASPEARPCYVCSACKGIFREQHPDLLLIERDEDRRLGVEQIRAARGQVEWRPYQAAYKIYIFVDADELSDGAANALLKTLEEPPPQALFILTASTEEALPSTVVSRCRVLPMQVVPASLIAEGVTRLYGASTEEAFRLARLAGGRPGWAIEALRDQEAVGRRERAIEQAIKLSSGPLGPRLLLAGEACKGENFVASRARCLRVLEDMQVWWRDLLLLASSSSTGPILTDHREELERQADRRGRTRIVEGLRHIESTASAVERNVTPRLALEALLLRLG